MTVGGFLSNLLQNSISMNAKILSVVAILAFFTYSCKDTPKEEKKETKVAIPQEQLIAKITMMSDSVKGAWTFMMEADDQKIAFVKRLLDEISYTPKYDIVKHAKLLEKCQALKAKRFDETSMSNSVSIDKYDAATDSLLREVKALVMSTPNVENYPLCGQLLNDITALDNDVVMHRVKYDNWAMEYNKVLDERKEEIAKLGATYANLPKKSTFQLPE